MDNKITEKKLNIITVEVMQILWKHGIDAAKFNEMHNDMRHQLSDHIVNWCGEEVENYPHYDHVEWAEFRRKNFWWAWGKGGGYAFWNNNQ